MVNLVERVKYFNRYFQQFNYLMDLNLDSKQIIVDLCEFSINNNDLPTCLAIIYPNYPWRISLQIHEDIRGERTFRKNTLPTQRQICEIHLAWGYQCPNQSPEKIHYDHFWPYGLGGSTDSDNLIGLCDRHNQLKGIDYHWYPFETTTQIPTWIKNQLDSISNRLLHFKNPSVQ